MSWTTPLTSLRRLVPLVVLVRKSARFSLVLMCISRVSPIATNSQIAWQQMELHFFFRAYSGLDELVNWDLLLPQMYMGPDKGIPIIRILYLSPHSVLILCSMAMNSAPKTESLIVACCFDSQMIGAKLQKMINPVLEHRVLFSPAWSLSTIIRRSTSLPRGGGMS